MKKIILRFKQQISKSSGFTLVELLIVLVLLGIVGTFIISTLFLALRGAAQTAQLNTIRANGNYALNQVTNMIRTAKSFNGTDQGSFCLQVDGSGNPDFTVPFSQIKTTSFDGGQTTFSCNGTNIASNSATLLDTTKVTLVSCNFYCAQTTADSLPVIKLMFTLKSNSGSLVENQSQQDFETTVIMRNNCQNGSC